MDILFPPTMHPANDLFDADSLRAALESGRETFVAQFGEMGAARRSAVRWMKAQRLPVSGVNCLVIDADCVARLVTFDRRGNESHVWTFGDVRR